MGTSRAVAEWSFCDAAVSKGTRITRVGGGLLDFKQRAGDARQIQVIGLIDPVGARQAILLHKDELTRMGER